MSDVTASATAMDKDKVTSDKSQTSSKKQKEQAPASLNMNELRELAELVNEHGFTDFEFENENIRVRLSKMTATQVVQAVQPAPVAQSAAPAAAEAATPSAAEVEEESLIKITSPIVGTFYRSPSPDKEPYVKEGTTVTPDTVVCIVEAMKLMNEIQAETTGEIVKVYVENGQPVEYGQPLFGIKK
jgi:acetyl-CoA carboxylase biotin carboxyl carrier protein